ncbi:MAG TPA: DUF6036 family nucleotidyltransferase [Solirubrobacteraceae bacterium]|nr:DUF6036 family nucleotidyltransferase [Solirubrobacteraceae bacterium]
MTLANDQLRLLDALSRHGAKFVVVGGVAAQLRGWSGTTADLDIAVDASDENATRINRALADAGVMSSAVGGFGTTFETRYGRLEIVRRADGIGKYEDWMRRASEIEFDHLTILVAASEDIVTSKEAAGRHKDLAALPTLRDDLGLGS